MKSCPAYRPEIDGLRCIAVLSVIFFHAGIAGFSGGYVGVDVFFVISGYLITGILLREITLGDFDVLRFYERRARRIMPALLLVLIVTLPFSWAWMAVPSYSEFTASLLAVLGFASNVFFWLHSSYFDAAVEFKPLLHTWSLAIEEQFYLFFPPFLFFLYRFVGARGSFLIVLMAAIGSLALAEATVRDHPVATFYLLPFRAWELLAGALCAFAHNYGNWRPKPSLALMGLSFILVAVFLYDSNTPFPSIYTLLPVFGSVLLVLYSSNVGLVGAILANQFFVAIGLISYSAYLWHQPMFSLARIRFDLHPGDIIFFPLTILVLGFAWLSWRFVEQPFRKSVSVKLFLMYCGIAFVFLAVVGTVGIIEYKYGLSRLSPIVYSKSLIDPVSERRLTWSKVLKNPNMAEELLSFPEDSGIKILILGDSHAKDLFNAVYLTEFEPRFHVRHISMVGRCTHRINARFEATMAQECFELMIQSAGGLLEEADGVLLTKRWVIDDTFEIYLPVFIENLRSMGKAVAIAGNTVEFTRDVPVILRQLADREVLDHDSSARKLGMSRRPEVAQVNAKISRIARSLGVPYLEKTHLLCHVSGHACSALTSEGEAIYFDYGHLTLAGAQELGQKIRETRWMNPLFDQLTIR